MNEIHTCSVKLNVNAAVTAWEHSSPDGAAIAVRLFLYYGKLILLMQSLKSCGKVDYLWKRYEVTISHREGLLHMQQYVL